MCFLHGPSAAPHRPQTKENRIFMKNVIFISPNFPTNYWKFCAALKRNGMNVLGIGDCPYEKLMPELKASLNEYYKVGSLENYDELYRAVAFFSFKYGKIDWLESNNEYWLEYDASLRTDFHITSGFMNDDMLRIKYKSEMKAYYEKAGIPVARYCMVTDYETCRTFAQEVGYPVIVKPDNGVGASHTYRLSSDEDLQFFFATKDDVMYIMEEYINGEVHTYDAIINSKGEPIFETGNVTMMSIMDIVNNNDNSCYYIEKNLPEKMREVGRKTVQAFGVKSRFVHLEFFELLSDHEGLGKKGDVMALEVNMRPSGGFSADMFNYANSTDVYQIWADMVAFDNSPLSDRVMPHYFCPYCGRRDGKNFKMDHNAIMAKYGSHIKMAERIPEALSGAMANMMYVATFETKQEMMNFYQDLCATY